MKASKQFQKQSASSVTPISQTSKRLQTRPFRDPNAPTTAQSSQSSLPAYDYDPSSRPAWWDRLTFNPQRPSTVQAKLTVGAPNDVYEQEADRVADQVMSMPDSATQQPLQREAMPEEELQTKPIAAAITPLVQREAMPEEEEPVQAKASGNPDIQREAMPDEEEEVQMKPLASGTLQREEMAPEEEELQMKSLGTANLQREVMPGEEDALQTKSFGTADLQREALPEEEDSLQPKSSPTPEAPHPTPSLESQLSNTQGSGSPLPNDVRSFMEPRFGADFSQVRVHTGSDAIQMNRDLNAQAFTHKQDVYFGVGKAPGKDALTAHELTHVVQQTASIQTKKNSEGLIQREVPDEEQNVIDVGETTIYSNETDEQAQTPAGANISTPEGTEDYTPPSDTAEAQNSSNSTEESDGLKGNSFTITPYGGIEGGQVVGAGGFVFGISEDWTGGRSKTLKFLGAGGTVGTPISAYGPGTSSSFTTAKPLHIEDFAGWGQILAAGTYMGAGVGWSMLNFYSCGVSISGVGLASGGGTGTSTYVGRWIV